MSNIVKELEASKKSQMQTVDTDEVVNEVKLLISSESQEDLRIFRALGKNHSITSSETELGKKIELEQLDGKYEGNVFTREQIKALAIKYNLRFLRSALYKGKMDVLVAPKIREFAKQTGTEITDGALEYNFFILAPEKSFKLTKERKRKFWEAKDPAIFYKIDEEHYKLIHKWGSDFTIMNRIKGLLNQNFRTALLVNFVICFITLAVAWFFTSTVVDAWSAWMSKFQWIVPVFSFSISFLCQAGRLNNLFEEDDAYYSPFKWNTNTKLE